MCSYVESTFETISSLKSIKAVGIKLFARRLFHGELFTNHDEYRWQITSRNKIIDGGLYKKLNSDTMESPDMADQRSACP